MGLQHENKRKDKRLGIHALEAHNKMVGVEAREQKKKRWGKDALEAHKQMGEVASRELEKR